MFKYFYPYLEIKYTFIYMRKTKRSARKRSTRRNHRKGGAQPTNPEGQINESPNKPNIKDLEEVRTYYQKIKEFLERHTKTEPRKLTQKELLAIHNRMYSDP
jgi:hypothetical protein